MSNFKVNIIGFDELSDDEKEVVPDNGSGKDCANYIKIIHNGNTVLLESDAMEPEDATFGRDLNWIIAALKECYEIGKIDGLNERVGEKS